MGVPPRHPACVSRIKTMGVRDLINGPPHVPTVLPMGHSLPGAWGWRRGRGCVVPGRWPRNATRGNVDTFLPQPSEKPDSESVSFILDFRLIQILGGKTISMQIEKNTDDDHRAFAVKVDTKRPPVFLFSGVDMYHDFRNDAFCDLYNLLNARKIGKREVVLCQPSPQTL